MEMQSQLLHQVYVITEVRAMPQVAADAVLYGYVTSRE
jgi:hypothetical protein